LSGIGDVSETAGEPDSLSASDTPGCHTD